MPDIREEFEAYVLDLFPVDMPSALARNEMVYLNPHIQQRWLGWQASRAALKVELLPMITVEDAAEHFDIDEDGIDMAVEIAQMVNGSIAACGALIKQAGIEVK